MFSRLRLKICYTKILIFQINLLFAFNLYSNGQERKDDEMPILIRTPETMAKFIGWARNDIGKWEQSSNKITSREKFGRLEIAKVSYENNTYWCVASFGTYGSFFWVLDSVDAQVLEFGDTLSIQKIYKNIIASDINILSSNPTWKDILIQMKKCFIGTSTNMTYIDEYFFLKYRFDNKSGLTQFYFGNYNTTIDSFTDNSSCYDIDENKNLNCCYFEIVTSIFQSFSNQFYE